MLRVIFGDDEVGGASESKLSRRRVAVAGVRFQAACAGDGVMLTKSEKSKLFPGVVGANPQAAPFVEGVICDDGSGVDLQGGVVGAWTMVLAPLFCAGDGEAARYMSRSAPSSPFFGVRDHETF